MKKIMQSTIFILFLLISKLAVAQAVVMPKPKPNTQVTISNTPLSPQVSDKVTEGVKEKAKADKVLNATVSKIAFSAWGDSRTPMLISHFESKSISIKGNDNNKFTIRWVLPPVSPGKYDVTWEFPVTGTTAYTYVNYEAFLDNGFTIKIDFSGKSVRSKDTEFAANYSVTFHFSDGTSVMVPLQGITIQGNKGVWLTTGDVHITKSFPGSAFPDPAKKFIPPTPPR